MPASSPVRLSLAMVAWDDADVIGRALISAAPVCDELVVIDAGSADRTVELASRYGATVHDLAWENDFSALRNAAFDLCTGDWILWLDPDEVVPPESRPVLADLRPQLNDDVDVVFCPQHGRIGDGGSPSLTFARERLVRRAAAVRWEGRAYERIAAPPERAGLHRDLVIEHRPGPDRETRDLERRAAILADWPADERPPETLFFLGNDLMYHGRFGEAADTYAEYLAVESDGEHRYWALVSRAECLFVFDEPEAGRQALLEAVGADSSRAEAFVTLGRLHADAEQWDEAVPLFLAATAASRPKFGFAREADYAYAPWDYLTICYEKLGRFAEALSAAERSLLAGNPEAHRVRANMHLMVDRL